MQYIVVVVFTIILDIVQLGLYFDGTQSVARGDRGQIAAQEYRLLGGK